MRRRGTSSVALRRGAVRFCYPAKGGVQRTLDVRDHEVRAVVRALLARDSGHPELLAYREADGPGWCDVRSTEINEYLRGISGIDISAKDFRTWDPRVFDLFHDGVTIADTLADLGDPDLGDPDLDDPVVRRAVEAAVLAMARVPHG